MAKKLSGTSALAGRELTGDSYDVFIESKICNGLSTNLLGRRFTAQVLMDMTPKPGSGTSGFAKPYICLSWRDGNGQYSSDNGCKLPDASGWYKFVSYTTVSIPDLTGVRLEVNLGPGWNGTMYVDDIELVQE